MRKLITIVMLIYSSILSAETPIIGTTNYAASRIECPGGVPCEHINESFCSQGNIEISPNEDSSFDLLFLDFLVRTTDSRDFNYASCELSVPVVVPPDRRVSLKEVSVGGFTRIPTDGLATTSITYYSGGRESKLTESFRTSQNDFIMKHVQNLDTGKSECGQGNAIINTRLDVTASRPTGQVNQAIVGLDSGAGKMVFKLLYEDCTQEPGVCSTDQFKIDGNCYDKGTQCSDYHNTSNAVCNNGSDNLQCDWDTQRSLCYKNCKSYQFRENGVCYDKASHCSEYNRTNVNVCNNGSDNLSCDWHQSEKTCVSRCPSNTFERNGVCYKKNGVCSQYNDTDNETCNNGSDNLSCDWIPHNFADSSKAKTCVSQCPNGSFSIDGQCYSKNGQCSQYNNTNSETCNTGKDNLQCDWNSNSKTCYSE